MADFLALTREVAPSARPGRAVTTVTTTGYGDINLVDAADGIKLFGMGLMLLRTVPLGSRALAVADLPGAALAGRTIDEAEAALELRVLVATRHGGRPVRSGSTRGRGCSCWPRVKAWPRSTSGRDRLTPCWGSRTASAPACSTWTAC